ncbi:MAG TPA: hypothetical protein VHE53_05565 [Patescibacteria group bacterium]|nr:hypothetical protein [Patescibacteria group bacterium]
MSEKLGPIFKEEGTYSKAAIFNSLDAAADAYQNVSGILARDNGGYSDLIPSLQNLFMVTVVGFESKYSHDEAITIALSKNGEIVEMPMSFVDRQQRMRHAEEINLSMKKRLTNLS